MGNDTSFTALYDTPSVSSNYHIHHPSRLSNYLFHPPTGIRFTYDIRLFVRDVSVNGRVSDRLGLGVELVCDGLANPHAK